MYNICAYQKPLTDILYDKIELFLKNYSLKIVMEILDPLGNDQSANLLVKYSSMWEKYKISANYFKQIFKYMKQVWKPNKPDRFSNIKLVGIFF